MKKQIILHIDADTHGWLKELAKSERRTIGAQILALALPSNNEKVSGGVSIKRAISSTRKAKKNARP